MLRLRNRLRYRFGPSAPWCSAPASGSPACSPSSTRTSPRAALGGAARDPAATFGIVVNPSKRAKVKLGAGDSIIVIAES
jgi:hypothetical protein